jgi:hypothetical protein
LLREQGPQVPEALRIPGFDDETHRQALTALIGEERIRLHKGRFGLNL